MALIYYKSTTAYFFDDDFHWLVQTQSFAPANMLDLSLYNHFYRPVIEIYFFLGLSLFGCDPFPFHLVSIGIHLLTTWFLYQFTRALSNSALFAFLSAMFFAIQPGFRDAVTWIGAVTDLLPVLWYVLTLWLHLLFLQRRNWRWYAGTLISFSLCHLTHESSATLLPMMLLVEFTFAAQVDVRARILAVARHWVRYAPFVSLLLAYLAIAYDVNTRSYLVQEGVYALGWHAIPNILNYIIWLYVGQRALLDYVVMIGVLAAVFVWGSPRMRFSVVWILVTLLPVSFFTWGLQGRYLYLPAAGFAMLVADLMLGFYALAVSRMSANTARLATVVVLTVLAVRFGLFAQKSADSFPALTAHYERFVAELRRTNPGATAGSTVYIDRRFLEGVPDLYREPAARVGLCLPDLHLQIR